MDRYGTHLFRHGGICNFRHFHDFSVLHTAEVKDLGRHLETSSAVCSCFHLAHLVFGCSILWAYPHQLENCGFHTKGSEHVKCHSTLLEPSSLQSEHWESLRMDKDTPSPLHKSVWVTYPSLKRQYRFKLDHQNHSSSPLVEGFVYMFDAFFKHISDISDLLGQKIQVSGNFGQCFGSRLLALHQGKPKAGWHHRTWGFHGSILWTSEWLPKWMGKRWNDYRFSHCSPMVTNTSQHLAPQQGFLKAQEAKHKSPRSAWQSGATLTDHIPPQTWQLLRCCDNLLLWHLKTQPGRCSTRCCWSTSRTKKS